MFKLSERVFTFVYYAKNKVIFLLSKNRISLHEKRFLAVEFWGLNKKPKFLPKSGKTLLNRLSVGQFDSVNLSTCVDEDYR